MFLIFFYGEIYFTVLLILFYKGEKQLQQAEYPYSNYLIYIVFHRKQKRNYACLVDSKNRKNRKTISYARYLMSVEKKRFLTKEEKVDHVNGIKTDDRIENLQLLSNKENYKKYLIQSSIKRKMVELECPNCKRIFIKEYNISHLGRKGGVFSSCSRKCAGTIRQKLQKGIFVDFSKNVIRIYFRNSF